MKDRLRLAVPGTPGTPASLTRPARRSRRVCSSRAARWSNGDSCHSENSANTAALAGPPDCNLLCVVFLSGGIATLRDAANALGGLLGGNRGAPGTPLIAGRCEHGPRHSARLGRSQFRAAADGGFHSERQARKVMRAGVLADAARTGFPATCIPSSPPAVVPAARAAAAHRQERGLRWLVPGCWSLGAP